VLEVHASRKQRNKLLPAACTTGSSGVNTQVLVRRPPRIGYKCLMPRWYLDADDYKWERDRVQMALLLQVHFFSAARPGAIVSSVYYPDLCLTYNDVLFALVRGRDGPEKPWNSPTDTKEPHRCSRAVQWSFNVGYLESRIQNTGSDERTTWNPGTEELLAQPAKFFAVVGRRT
jgi:hypothetical protein